MESNYKEGNIFRSKRQKSFKVRCTGIETISFFEGLKISGSGLPILDQYKNYNKDAFELEIQPTEKQLLIKKSLSEVAKNILQISASLEEMNNIDAICAIGGNVSLLDLVLKKLEK
ncbi:hypothetical protein D3C85_822630 [compost metagenome]